MIQHSEIADRLREVSVNPKHVIEFLKGISIRKPKYAFLNELLDAELDIDRLDFLLRDSYYCGVTYGKYDLDRLILSMKTHNNEEIVITEKGIHSVEIYVLARFNMYLQVYAHHTRRAFDLMLETVFSNGKFESLGYPKPNGKEIDEIIIFDDSWLLGKIREIAEEKGNPHRASLANQFLKRNPIRRVCECLAFKDVREPGKRELPAYTTLSHFCTRLARKQTANLSDIPIEEAGEIDHSKTCRLKIDIDLLHIEEKARKESSKF